MVNNHGFSPLDDIVPVIATEPGFHGSPFVRNLVCPICRTDYVHIIRFANDAIDLWCESHHLFRYGFEFHKGQTEVRSFFIGSMDHVAAKKQVLGE